MKQKEKNYLEIFYRNATLAIVIDLSKPSEIWFTLESLLAAAKSRIETIIAEVKGENPQIREQLKKRAWQRVGEDNPVSYQFSLKYLENCILYRTVW